MRVETMKVLLEGQEITINVSDFDEKKYKKIGSSKKEFKEEIKEVSVEVSEEIQEEVKEEESENKRGRKRGN